MTISAPTLQDFEAVNDVLASAFGNTGEVELVQGLRTDGAMAAEFIDCRNGVPVGHIAFSPLSGGVDLFALAPLAVRPDWQRQGVGTGLVHHGLDHGRRAGWKGIYVLGDPAYCRRFGFSQAKAKGVDSPYAGDHFMAMELVENGLDDVTGPLRHAAIFQQLEGDV